MATVRSRITKGRQFQKRVMEQIRDTFNLNEEDIRTAIGAESGEDIKLISKKAKAKVGLSIECKDQKKIGILAALRQAKVNCPNGQIEAVIFKNGELGSHTTYICVPLEHYLEIRKEDAF